MNKHIFRWITIFLVVSLVIVGITVIFNIYQTSAIKNEYETIYRESSVFATSSFDLYVEQAIDFLDSKGSDSEGEFFALGKIITEIEKLEDGEEEIEVEKIYLTYEKAGSVINKEEISDSMPDKILGTKDEPSSEMLFFYKGNFFGQELILFSKEVDSNYYIAYLDYEDFIAKLNNELFLDVMIATEKGEVLCSALESTKPLDTVYGEAYNNLKKVQESKLVLNRDVEHIVLAKKAEKTSLYFVATISGMDINNRIKLLNNNSIIFSIVIAIVSYAAMALILILYILLNNRNMVGAFSRGKYSIIIDPTGKIIFANKTFKEDFEVEGILDYVVKNPYNLASPFDKNGDITIKLLNKLGTERYVRFMSAKILRGYRLLGTDITDFMGSYLEAQNLATMDYKTQLPSYEKLMSDYATFPKKHPKESFCIAIVLLRELDEIKNMFGENVAEELRLSFAKRLSEMFEGMVYHFSDTRFYIFANNLLARENWQKNTDKLALALSAPVKIATHNLQIKFNAGVSQVFSAIAEMSLEQLIKQANLALNSSISLNRKFTIYFDALMQNDLAVYEERSAILNLIEKGFLTLHYQPQYSLFKEKIVGFEALLRIKKKTNISISEFIELAEKNGSIIEIGDFVYKSAMDFAKILDGKACVSLNVSPFQLVKQGFVENILSHYRKAKLKPNSIALEITESYLMSDYEGAIEKLNILRKEGIKIHLDDFGIAHSSMLYLKKLPITAIKIDREFVKDIVNDDYSKMVVEIIAKSCKNLKLDCIAEGVETLEQAKLLKSIGCENIQGFLFSSAVPSEEALKMLEDDKKLKS